MLTCRSATARISCIDSNRLRWSSISLATGQPTVGFSISSPASADARQTTPHRTAPPAPPTGRRATEPRPFRLEERRDRQGSCDATTSTNPCGGQAKRSRRHC